MRPNVKDTAVATSIALPTGASSVTSAAIDLGITSSGDFSPDGVEFLVTAPALAVGELANASTMKYAIVHSVNSDLSAPAVLAAEVIVQTGAGGAGAATATARFKLPTDVRRYVGLKATNSAAADASAKTATLEAVF